MPIYAYKCASCGFAKDVLQKISDAPLTECPSCGKSSFSKQVTAAGFQLKGSGWYVTDFRGGSGGGSAGTTNASTSSNEPSSTGGSDAPVAAPAASATTTSSSEGSAA